MSGIRLAWDYTFRTKPEPRVTVPILGRYLVLYLSGTSGPGCAPGSVKPRPVRVPTFISHLPMQIAVSQNLVTGLK